MGLVLYELLCGGPPYVLLEKTLDGAIQTIRERLPTPPRSVNAALDEDIETILLKALHKDRDRRYPTAAALASSRSSRTSARIVWSSVANSRIGT